MYGILAQAIAFIGSVVLAFKGQWGAALQLFVISQVLFFVTKIAMDLAVKAAVKRLDEGVKAQLSIEASIGMIPALPPSVHRIGNMLGIAYLLAMIGITYLYLQ